jgi:transcription elongation factor SPT4
MCFSHRDLQLFLSSELPTTQKGLRACLRCSLIKNFDQFYNNGCENCEPLGMEGNTTRIHEVTCETA